MTRHAHFVFPHGLEKLGFIMIAPEEEVEEIFGPRACGKMSLASFQFRL